MGGIGLDLNDRADVASRKIVWDRPRLQFQLLADAAPIMIWMTEADGYCSYANKKWYAFTGLPAKAAVGSGWLNSIHPGDQNRTARTMIDATIARERFIVAFRMIQDSTYFRRVTATAEPYFDDEGVFRGYLGSSSPDEEGKEAPRRGVTAVSTRFTDKFSVLTAREAQVLELLVKGLPNKAVGELLGISARTIEVHRARVMQKLGARNAAEMVRIALAT